MAFCQAIVRPNASNGIGREIMALFIGMAARAFTEGAGTVVVLVHAGPRRLLGQYGTAVDNELGAISIGDCGLFRLLAVNSLHGIWGLLQHNLLGRDFEADFRTSIYRFSEGTPSEQITTLDQRLANDTRESNANIC
jgi:hypothetical protein